MATRREEKRKMTAEVTRETLTQLIAQEMERQLLIPVFYWKTYLKIW